MRVEVVIKKMIFFTGFLVMSSCLYAQSADPNFHLYLLVGQSNMAGRGAIDSISKQVDPQIWMLNKNNHWVPATDPVHFDKPGVAGAGLAISFAKEMIKGNKKIKIGLVPCAVGGSPIKVWEPDSSFAAGLPDTVNPYDDAIKRMRVAMKTGVLKGILWHQGESDSNPRDAKVYLDKLKSLIARLREVSNNKMLPFVAGETGHFYHNNDSAINVVIRPLPAEVKNTAVVSAAGLTHKGDSTHFNTPSLRILGIRYATAMKQLQGMPKK